MSALSASCVIGGAERCLQQKQLNNQSTDSSSALHCGLSLEASSELSYKVNLFPLMQVEWAHVDIAGPAWDEKAGGATGFGATTLAEWAIAQGK